MGSMTWLYQLKNGEYARLVEIDHDPKDKTRYESKGIVEGSIFLVISNHRVIVFRIGSSVFALSKHLAKRFRVIPLNTSEC